MVGRVVAGLLLDRSPAPLLSAAVMTLPTVGFLLGAAGQAPPLVYAILVGLAGGAEFDLVAFMTARYFGLRHFGKLYGILFSPIIVGAAIGPMLFGFGYGRFGSYAPVLGACGAVFALATAAQFALGQKRHA
jgi:MFS family permease